MQPTVFEHTIFLQSIGWAIVNSIWQMGLLWACFKTIEKCFPSAPAIFRHNISVAFLLGGTAWFAGTTFYNYTQLKQGIGISWLPSIELNQTLYAWILPIISIVYLVALSVHITRWMSRFYATVQLKQPGIKPAIDCRVFVQQMSYQMGITRSVKVWISNKVDVPAVIGFIKPVILLPIASLQQLSTTELEAILVHELAHIKRNDYLINIIQSIAMTMMWFNPFARLLNSTIQKEREFCCDDWVLNYKYAPRQYAQALLLLEQQRQMQWQMAMTASNGKAQLLQRIQRLFSEPNTNIQHGRRQQSFFVAITALLIAVLMAGSSSLQQPKLQAFTDIVQPEAVLAATYLEQTSAGASRAASISTEAPYLEEVAAQPSIGFNNQPATAQAAVEVAASEPATPDEIPDSDTLQNYTLALLNEDLLVPQLPTSVSPAALSDANAKAQQPVIIKIEEEQSGVQNRKTYYLQLNVQGDSTLLKPLLLLQQGKKVTPKKAPKKKLEVTS